MIPNMSHSEGLLYFWVVLVLITLIYFSGIYPQLKRSSLSNIPIYENIDGYPVLLQHQGKIEFVELKSNFFLLSREFHNF